jgi:hypothetical protein
VFGIVGFDSGFAMTVLCHFVERQFQPCQRDFTRRLVPCDRPRPIVVVFAGTHQIVMVCVGILEVLSNVSLYVYRARAGMMIAIEIHQAERRNAIEATSIESLQKQ